MSASGSAIAKDALDFSAACPAPFQDYERVVLGHGSGGRLSHDLLARVILPALGRDPNEPLEDQATLPAIDGRIAMTTDAFVIRPLFFPAATSAAWRCTARSTISRWAVPSRFTSPRR